MSSRVIVCKNKKERTCKSKREDPISYPRTALTENLFFAYTDPGSYSFSVPIGAVSVVAELFGGGGGGTTAFFTTALEAGPLIISGGGGGSGAAIKATVLNASTIFQSTILNLVVGSGGPAAMPVGDGLATNSGGNGTATTLKTTNGISLSAGGGLGAPGIPVSVVGGESQGGAGGVATVIGLQKHTFEAENGEPGQTVSFISGGFGGTPSLGGGVGGYGGQTISVLGPLNTVNGTSGTSPGGGGGGASVSISAVNPGTSGSGANGAIRLFVTVVHSA